ncbi:MULTISPECIES: hypothetical protein [Halomonas]|uniref:hypothetical protein n=1 Tax=Halomonas TaxID=2745 RepID=UPI001C9385A3|nr:MULTISPECIES: hypothetical protein [Halomonas]MBY6209434.1 hypothetical protein [Halomonas sp. DP3Y7-2]MBY6229589.1 hypothetical protein [Halomonas sp. DP3Y7-1]MCA0917351.1 hypothetical protein [Halomonas denitrificans]
MDGTHDAVMLLYTSGAVALGSIVRWLDSFRKRDMTKLNVPLVATEVCGGILLVVVSIGLSDYFYLKNWTEIAVAVMLGRVGPSFIGRWAIHLIERMVVK